MLELNKIYNEDCFITMNNIANSDYKIDIVLTSPPYNTSRVGRKDPYSTRYNGFLDNKSDEEYIQWTLELFKMYDKILIENGCILYNISYSSEKPDLLWRLIGKIIEGTNLTISDCITWKKKSAIPNNVSHNKLTRIVEYVFVLCRKDEINTFKCNKKVKSINERTNQKYYENMFNYIEASNNDGANKLNRATFSSELCFKLFDMYLSKDNSIVYDSFMGTGTTAFACINYNYKKIYYIGSEISKEQCEFSNNRLNKN